MAEPLVQLPDDDDEDVSKQPYEAAQIETDPTTDTVEGRINRIIDTNSLSPLLQGAQTRAKQDANARGLRNSSMAVTAGQQAVYNTVTPIATTDANLSLQTKAANQLATNKSREIAQTGLIESRLIDERGKIEKEIQSADTATKLQLQERQGEIDTALQTLRGSQEIDQVREQGEIEAGLIAQRGEVDRGLQELRGDQNLELAQLDNDYRVLIQSSASASSLYSQTMTAVSAILANPDIPVSQKQQLVDKQFELLRGGLAVTGGLANIDLSPFVGPTPESKPLEPPTKQEAKEAKKEAKALKKARKKRG